MTKFLSNLHLNQNQLIQAVLQNSGTEPQSAVKGQVFFDTTANRLKVCDCSGDSDGHLGERQTP